MNYLKMIINILTLLILSSLSLSQSTNIEGTIQHIRWNHFNARLLAFRVTANTKIDTHSAEISSNYNEQVTAILMKDENAIQALPAKVSEKFPNLKLYEAHNCSIIEISKENFENLNRLVIIDLQYNDLIAIPENSFDDQRNLIYLDLAHNKIIRLYQNSFKNLKNLQILYLGWNQIEALPKNVFSTLSNLKKIALTSNNLRRISNEHFDSNRKLTNIWLNENKIEFIEDEKIFDASSGSLKSVDMEMNRCINRIYSEDDLWKLKRDIERNCRRK